MVAHVDDHGVGLLGEGVELVRGDVLPAIGDVEAVVVKAIRDDFVPDLDDQLQEAFVVAVDGDVEADTAQPVDRVKAVLERIHRLGGQAELGVDAFTAHIDATQHAEGFPGGEEVVPEERGILHLGVTVQAEGGPCPSILVESVDQGGPVQSVVQRLVHDGNNIPCACAGMFRDTIRVVMSFAPWPRIG